MNGNVIVFAGTTEGRILSEYISGRGIPVTASVATEYGKELLKERPNLCVRAGRMDALQMQDFFREKKPELVIDATHPYAVEATEQIRTACAREGVEYLRVARKTDHAADAVYVPSAQAAAEYLNRMKGNILLAIGSKELSEFTDALKEKQRLYVRVLSLPEAVAECSRMGISGSHLYAMQGPFSEEMDIAMLHMVNAKWLVTKETGRAGGFEQKRLAAQKTGAGLIVIGKPAEESGVSLEECMKLLQRKFGFMLQEQRIALVGIGMGAKRLLTAEAVQTIEQADVVIGAKRMVEAVANERQERYVAYQAEQIADYIREHPEYERIVVALSGDVGFYSGAKKLLAVLPETTELIPGISSAVYFASRLKTSWDDICCGSIHGKQEDVLRLLARHRRVFLLLGTGGDAGEICRRLAECGMGDVKVSLGEDLGYDTEKITVSTAEDLQGVETSSLSVCLLEREGETKSQAVTGSIRDEAFFRNQTPMTKEEIRTLSLAKLGLREDSVLYDIGAGSGSVSVEAAVRMEQGEVYAVEQSPEALALLSKNRAKFGAGRMRIVPGTAPEAMEELPVPTHAFIGGSGGRLNEILAALLAKNPNVRVVITAVSLETVSEAAAWLKDHEPKDAETICVSVARAKELGGHHLMMANNPVYIFSFSGGGTKEGNYEAKG